MTAHIPKLDDFMKILSSLILLFLLSFSVFSQGTPLLLKVDEYVEDNSFHKKSLEKKAKDFAGKLRQTSNDYKGLIEIYPSIKEACAYRKTKNTAEEHTEYFKKLLITKYKIPAEKIDVRFANKFRSNTTLEFWLIPKRAALPDSAGLIVDCICPQITINLIEKNERSGRKILKFSSNVSGGSSENVTYKWQTSAGKIINGQNTPFIEVNYDGVSAGEIIVTLMVEGCNTEFCVPESLSVKIN